jgi:hypothetical protein
MQDEPAPLIDFAACLGVDARGGAEWGRRREASGAFLNPFPRPIQTLLCAVIGTREPKNFLSCGYRRAITSAPYK